MNQTAYENKQTPENKKPNIFILLIKSLIPFVLIAAGVLGAIIFVKTKPVQEKQAPKAEVSMVETTIAHYKNHPVQIEVTGTVIPAQEVQLKARVSGEIIKINSDFQDGMTLKKGAVIAWIDPVDYENQVSQQESLVVTSEYNLAIEKGRQEIAKKEWELLKKQDGMSKQNMDLVLRKPHLKKEQAALKSAKASLKQAKLNLTRTKIKAPFNGFILDKNIDLGTQVSTQESIARLIGTDIYWVETQIPIDRLSSISYRQTDGTPGSKATVRLMTNNWESKEWTGEVLRILGDLETQGRMAKVLIEVKNPKKSEAEQLLLSSYVHVKIEGHSVENAIKLNRAYLRDDQYVWIAKDDKTLDIRPVTLKWKSAQDILIGEGIYEDEKIIISDLPVPVKGMPITWDLQDLSEVNSDRKDAE